MTTVGYIGIGDMGSAMAGHLARCGADLAVFDLRAEAMEAVAAHGAGTAGSIAELAANRDAISVCVPADHHVVDVVAGDEGILTTARPGTIVLVHSTVHPDTVRDLHRLAAEREVVLLDAAVAGGAAKAEQGDLAMFLGVPEAGVPAEARALVETYAGAAFDAGPVGAGAALKIAVNIMTYLQFAAASAAHELARGEGVHIDALLGAWRHTGQLGALTEQFFPLLGLPREMKMADDDFGRYLRTTIAIAEKDLDLAVSLGREVGRDMPIVAAARDAMDLVYGMREDT
jgi:3-hydroxyisobutyrate dehydrogenase